MFITPWEVIQNSPLNKEFPIDKVAGYVDIREAFLKDCFGCEFLEILADDLAEVPDQEYTEFVYGISYLLGTYMVYNGVPYQANVDTASIPGTSPDWTLFKKFTNDIYNELWDTYLKQYLALDIAAHVLRYGITQQRISESNDLASTRGLLSDYKSDILVQRDQLKTIMIEWILKKHNDAVKANDTVLPFKTIGFIKASCCTPATGCSTVSRRVAFRY